MCVCVCMHACLYEGASQSDALMTHVEVVFVVNDWMLWYAYDFRLACRHLYLTHVLHIEMFLRLLCGYLKQKVFAVQCEVLMQQPMEQDLHMLCTLPCMNISRSLLVTPVEVTILPMVWMLHKYSQCWQNVGRKTDIKKNRHSVCVESLSQFFSSLGALLRMSTPINTFRKLWPFVLATLSKINCF